MIFLTKELTEETEVLGVGVGFSIGRAARSRGTYGEPRWIEKPATPQRLFNPPRLSIRLAGRTAGDAADALVFS